MLKWLINHLPTPLWGWLAAHNKGLFVGTFKCDVCGRIVVGDLAPPVEGADGQWLYPCAHCWHAMGQPPVTRI